ncbi:hypothetical protein ACPW7J_04825 [Ihubacter sp. rT4E-8]|uniref:hypothetical protein n=1 Tax=Ihubacter sp. rT4E-8 TaxID=3242369 RepID=UPI003CF032AF
MQDVIAMCRNVDLGEDNDFDSDISEDVEAYLIAKQDAWQNFYERNDTVLNQYNISGKLEGELQSKELDIYLYSLETEYIYGDSEERSGEVLKCW